MSQDPIGVVSALPEEISPLVRRLRARRRRRLGGYRIATGSLGEVSLIAMVSGDGAERARLGLEALLSRFDLQAVLVIGIAGGLSTDLEVGDVVVAQRVANGTGEVPSPDRQWHARALALEGVVDGSIYSHHEIAVDPVVKGRLWQETGSRSSQVVDLESASYARVAAAHEVPYVAFRAVSDSAQEALPLDFNRFRKVDGSSDRLRITRHIVRHPSIVPELLQLRERLRYCAEQLARLTVEMLTP